MYSANLSTFSMKPKNACEKETLYTLVLVLLIGLTARLIYLSEVAHYPNFKVPYAGLDAALYHSLAEKVAAGDLLLGNDVFYYSSTFVYFLGTLYRIFGESPWIPRIANFIFGMGTVGSISSTAKKFFKLTQLLSLLPLVPPCMGPC